MSFYEYNQNNSGGSFVINDAVTMRVFIEANTSDEADEKAQEIGIYFDGCDKGWDCDCCGDRWHVAYREADYKTVEDIVKAYEPVEEGGGYTPYRYAAMWAADQEPYVHIYTADGQKTTLVKGK